ncbi:MAG: hypothetical protein LBD24_09355 [Spirochaetaceae bacterium]|nr:hypothetical protein [Spirochaetaceae bacterium]
MEQSETAEAARSVAAPKQHGLAQRTRCCTTLRQQAAMFETAGGCGGGGLWRGGEEG